MSEGITTAHHVIAWDGSIEALEDQYRADATLPLRVISKACTTNVEKARRLGGRVFGGDIFLDGSIGSRTAAVEHGYRDGDGSGLLYLNRDQLFELFDEATESGLSLGVHAIGDRAIEEAISAWEAVIAKRGSIASVRPSIDHFEIANPEQIARAARCGMLLSMQPAFDYLWGGADGMYAQRFGAERALGMNLFKTARRAGCFVCGGSDSPVTKFSALLGISSLVNHHVPAERFTTDEALRVYCVDAARLSFDETRRGKLAPGWTATSSSWKRVSTPWHTPILRALASWQPSSAARSASRPTRESEGYGYETNSRMRSCSGSHGARRLYGPIAAVDHAGFDSVAGGAEESDGISDGSGQQDHRRQTVLANRDGGAIGRIESQRAGRRNVLRI